MKTAGWRNRRGALLAVALGSIVLAVVAYATNLLRAPELKSLDTRYSIRGPVKPPSNIVIVAVDGETLRTIYQYNWPFPRRFDARVIENVRRSGAKSIAVDLQYTQSSGTSAQGHREDELLAAAAEETRGKIALATTEVGPHGETAIFGASTKDLRSIGIEPASAILLLDTDGTVREFPWGRNGVPSLGVAAYQIATRKAVPKSQFDHGGIPIDFAGGPNSFPSISFSKVYKGEYPANEFRGKTVLIGATASILQDVHTTATSGSSVMPGPEIWANVVGTLENGIPLRRASAFLDILIVCLMGAAIPLLYMRFARVSSALMAVPLAALYAVFAQLAFNSGLIINFVYSELALLLAFLGTLLVLYMNEAVERQRVRDLFGRYVAPDVIEQVVEGAGENLRLGAVERDCTVLFSDLRGFTSFSETQPAAQVIDVINTYLSEMTEAIQDAGGTLICYMGDGIMAVFGAPITQDDHADRAVRAAREMITTRLTRFNDWINEHGHEHRFKMGVGLNSGNVMAGNIGAENRVEYTALGDTTNTAARLEGMTKGSGHELFLAETTRERLKGDYPELKEVGELEVRGRVHKVPVWTIDDDGDGDAGTPASA